MTPLLYNKQKKKLIADAESRLKTRFSDLQSKLYISLVEDFVDGLEVDGNGIKNSQSNIRSIAKIDKLFDKLIRLYFGQTISEISNSLVNINNLNVKYFKNVAINSSVDFGKMAETVSKKTLNRYGLENTGKVIKGGFFESFIKDRSVLSKVKQLTSNAIVSRTTTKAKFLKGLKDYVVGEGVKMGAYEKHLNTYVNDLYSKYDRINTLEFKDRLGLKYAVYGGGLIETSRPFCEERNNKIFSVEEIETWGTSKDKLGGYETKKDGYFKGKPDIYDPFTDCGGYNCRHTLNYVTLSEAARRGHPKAIIELEKLKAGK